MEKIEAIGNHVVLEMVPEEEAKNGFFMTTLQSQIRKGIVIAVGDGIDAKSPLKKGKMVLVKPEAGIEVDFNAILDEAKGTHKVVEVKDILIVY